MSAQPEQPMNPLGQYPEVVAPDAQAEAAANEYAIVSPTAVGVEAPSSARSGPKKNKSWKKSPREVQSDAALEHVREKLPLWTGINTIKEKYGLGIYLYFDFLRFIMGFNVVLLMLALINYISAVRKENKENLGSLEVLFMSAYESASRSVWRGSNITAGVLFFMCPVLYYFFVVYRFKKMDTVDEEGTLQISEEEDKIIANEHYPRHKRFVRRFISYIIFALLIGIQGAIQYFLTREQFQLKSLAETQATKTSEQTAAGISFSVLIIVLKFIFKAVCGVLTRFERHRTWTTYRVHASFKFVLFQVLNVMSSYIAVGQSLRQRAAFRTPPPVSNVYAGCNPTVKDCIWGYYGSQFFFLLILDLTVLNLVELVLPWLKVTVKYVWNKYVKHIDRGTDEDRRPEFDLADEYLEIVYRQFIVYVGMTSFPLITAFGCVANIIEYWLDKFRLFRICRKPKPVKASMKTMLMFYLTFIAICSIIAYPIGSGFVLPNYVEQYCGVFSVTTPTIWKGVLDGTLPVSSLPDVCIIQ